MNDSTKILKLLDVVELVGYDADSSTILKEIIDNYDSEIANGIKNHKVAKIPYIGNIRRNTIREEFRKAKSKIRLTDIRKTTTKEKYKEYTKNLYINSANKAKRDDRLCATAGKPYADMYIYCMGIMKVVPTTPNKYSKYKFTFEPNET